MGMNVTGVNSYATNALPTTAPSYTSKVQASLLSQPAYDTVSFSGNYQTQQKEEGMSTGAKAGLVAVAATAVIGLWAASRGKKINGESSKGLIDNLKTGVKSIFTKAGRESYKAKFADKLDDVAKAASNTSKKGATKFTQETIETASAKAEKAQKKIASLQKQISELDPAKDAEKIKQLQKQVTQQEATVKKFVNLTTSENLASDKAYKKLKETKAAAAEALDSATSKKSTLEAKKTAIKKKKEAIEAISKKKRTAEQITQLQHYNDEIGKIDTKIQNIVNGTKDASGKVVTKPLSELEKAHADALKATKQYKQAAKTLSEAQITATNNTQQYRQMLAKKDATLTPEQGLIDKVDSLKAQADASSSLLDKLKKAWEEFAKTGTYNESVFGKI